MGIANLMRRKPNKIVLLVSSIWFLFLLVMVPHLLQAKRPPPLHTHTHKTAHTLILCVVCLCTLPYTQIAASLLMAGMHGVYNLSFQDCFYGGVSSELTNGQIESGVNSRSCGNFVSVQLWGASPIYGQ